MVELFGRCVKSFRTRAPPPPPRPRRQHGLRPVPLSSRALCQNPFKTLCGHPLKPQAGPFNSEAHGLTMSYLSDIPAQIEALPRRARCAEQAFNSPTRRCPKGSRMQPKLQTICSSRKSPCCLLLGRSCRQRRGRLHLLGAPGKLQKMQPEASTGNGRSPTPKSPSKPEL